MRLQIVPLSQTNAHPIFENVIACVQEFTSGNYSFGYTQQLFVATILNQKCICNEAKFRNRPGKTRVDQLAKHFFPATLAL